MKKINSYNLTDRETEVLKLLILGLKNSEISEKLYISSHTTKAHLASIYKKLKVSNRVQATAKILIFQNNQELDFKLSMK